MSTNADRNSCSAFMCYDVIDRPLPFEISGRTNKNISYLKENARESRRDVMKYNRSDHTSRFRVMSLAVPEKTIKCSRFRAKKLLRNNFRIIIEYILRLTSRNPPVEKACFLVRIKYGYGSTVSLLNASPGIRPVYNSIPV